MTSTKQDIKNNEIKPFPKLMINNEKSVVILASTGDNALIYGVVLWVDLTKKNYDIGHLSGTWLSDSFTDYEGAVTLEN